MPARPPDPQADAVSHAAAARQAAALRRRSAIAGGVAVIAGLFILETLAASRLHPHPATPYIRLGLGAVALVALVLAVVWRVKAGHR